MSRQAHSYLFRYGDDHPLVKNDCDNSQTYPKKIPDEIFVFINFCIISGFQNYMKVRNNNYSSNIRGCTKIISCTEGGGVSR